MVPDAEDEGPRRWAYSDKPPLAGVESGAILDRLIPVRPRLFTSFELQVSSFKLGCSRFLMSCCGERLTNDKGLL